MKRKTPTAAEQFDQAHANLCASLGRLPFVFEIAVELGVTAARVREILARKVADLGIAETDPDGRVRTPEEQAIVAGLIARRHRRCDLDKPIDHLGPVARLAVQNMRRVYADLTSHPMPPSDADLGAAAGFRGRPDQNAMELRKYVEGDRVPSLERLGKLAAALGVHVGEMLRPVES